MKRRRIIIMGAAGRDFHNFNLLYRHERACEVVAFTATQIPDIENRIYPPELAGPLYPEGIPILHESELSSLIRKYEVDEVLFSYSDVSNQTVMHLGAQVNSAGAAFILPDVKKTMLRSRRAVISICAVRTGCGKSQTARRVVQILRQADRRVAVVRHPMPYGNLFAQKCQRFETYEDLERERCTIEEREEYEPHLAMRSLVFAGADYREVLRAAEREADVIVWDGGNNDTPFFAPNLHIVVMDPLRAGHELRYYPSEINLRMADVVVINKERAALRDEIALVRRNVSAINPSALIIDAASPVTAEDGAAIAGKRVLAVEDGPTVTHGGMKYGAAVLAARQHGAAELVDPRPWLAGTLRDTFERYPEIGALLPAMGYSEKQVADLEETIRRVECDLVLIGTPIDLRKLIEIDKPVMRVTYELEELGKPDLAEALRGFLPAETRRALRSAR